MYTYLILHFSFPLLNRERKREGKELYFIHMYLLHHPEFNFVNCIRLYTIYINNKNLINHIHFHMLTKNCKIPFTFP